MRDIFGKLEKILKIQITYYTLNFSKNDNNKNVGKFDLRIYYKVEGFRYSYFKEKEKTQEHY